MERPKKKILTDDPKQQGSPAEMEDIAYNQACTDWEAYLPSEDDVEQIIRDNIKWSPYGLTNYDMVDSFTAIAKAISKRLKGVT